MSVIWKFRVDPWTPVIEMPRGARLLSVIGDGRDADVYALVDPHAPPVRRRLVLVATGERQRWETAVYVGTFVSDERATGGMRLVFHIFDGGELTEDPA